jgi:hypothetical protein
MFCETHPEEFFTSWRLAQDTGLAVSSIDFRLRNTYGLFPARTETNGVGFRAVWAMSDLRAAMAQHDDPSA